MHQRVVTALFSLMALGACLPREPAGPEAGAEARLLVRADVSGTSIAMVVVEVTAPDIATPLVFDIPTVNGVATGTITIRAGSNRTIALRAYDAGGVETHTGSVTRDIAPGTNPAISIILAPLTGDVPVTVTLGSFTVVVTPAAANLLPGDTTRLTATILDVNGTPVTDQVAWATMKSTVATVVATGPQAARVTAVGGGEATVVAVYGGVAGSTTITVAAPAVAVPTLVQHVSTPFTRDTIPGLNIYLPNKSLPHNCLLVAVQYGSEAGVTASVSDDQGNTYHVGDEVASPYSRGAVPSRARHLAVFYALNARAGVVHITVSFTGGSADLVSAVASEWYNIALTNALDGSSDSATVDHATSTWAAGSITTSAGGDLVYQVAVDEDLARHGSFTAGDSFKLTSADLLAGTVTQYTVQGAPGVISPTVFVGGADAYETVAIALKAAAAGTAPGPGIRIVHMYVGNSGQGATTVPLQAPSSGNLLVFTLTRDFDALLTGIADGNGNTYTEVPGSPITNGFGGIEWMFYAANAVTSSSLTLTLTFDSPLPLGSGFIVYDIAGAAASPFDTSNTAMGNQTSDGFNGELTTVSITPAGAGELVIARGDEDAGTITGLVGQGYMFDNPTWPGQDEQGDGGAAAEFTLDSQAGHYYTLDASPVTFVWITTRPVAQWETIAAAFKGAVTGGPPPSSPNPHEPAGFTPIFEKDFSTLPGVGTDLYGVSNIAYEPQNFAIVQDASAPLTPSGTLLTTWPSGVVGGNGPGRWNFWDALPERNGTPYREVYVSFRAKVPTANFENQAVGTKLFYLSHGGDGTYATNDEFLVLENGDVQKLMSSMQLAYYTAEADDRDTAEVNGGSGVPRYQNVNTTKQFTCGVWNQIELYVNVGTPNNHDGIVRVWIDTVLVTEYTNIKFLDTDYNYTRGVYSGQWTPIWGGVGGTKTRDDFMLLDHFYVSGRP